MDTDGRPICYMLMGIQVSGKSSFAQDRFPFVLRLSRDLLGSQNASAGNRQHHLFYALLATQTTFVFDNTNLTAGGREHWLAPLRAAGYRIEGFYFEPDVERCQERNAGRPRPLPPKAILGAAAKWQTPTREEGFDELTEVGLGRDLLRGEPVYILNPSALPKPGASCATS